MRHFVAVHVSVADVAFGCRRLRTSPRSLDAAVLTSDPALPSVDFLSGNHAYSAVSSGGTEGANVFRERIRCR
jgi:hypothetical protein